LLKQRLLIHMFNYCSPDADNSVKMGTENQLITMSYMVVKNLLHLTHLITEGVGSKQSIQPAFMESVERAAGKARHKAAAVSGNGK